MYKDFAFSVSKLLFHAEIVYLEASHNIGKRTMQWERERAKDEHLLAAFQFPNTATNNVLMCESCLSL